MKINKRKTEILALQDPEDNSQVADIRVVKKAKYLGMVLSTHTTEIVREAWNSTRKYLGMVKHKLRQCNPDVKEAILAAYARSLLIYFGVPLLAAKIVSQTDIER